MRGQLGIHHAGALRQESEREKAEGIPAQEVKNHQGPQSPRLSEGRQQCDFPTF
jgi:hypothetical protein